MSDKKSIEYRAVEWFASGDTGMSSETLARHMLGMKHTCTFGISDPVDNWDLGRCLRLLAKIPEWEQCVPELAKLSHAWAALVPQWDRLKSLMIEETGPNFERTKPAPRTYQMMRELIDGAHKNDGWIALGNGVSIRSKSGET